MMNQEASSLSWFHDVFISSIEEYTNQSFMDELYTALVQAKIGTFRNGEIGTERLKAIEESRVAIIIFSMNYVCSTCYLDELVRILDCRKMVGQTALPIFYDVDPSDVRKQSGSLAQEFAEFEESFKLETGKVRRWREALTEAANLSGWDLRDVANGHYSKFIDEIIEEVLARLNQKQLDFDTYLVGMDSHVEKVNSLLSIESSDIRIIGICGVGGIGKTTIAKAVYNLSFHRFGGSSFLANVREASEQPNGLVRLQEQLLSDILMKKNIRINNVDRGVMLIEKRLQYKKVLVILDDVDELNQINALVRKRAWFGAGSRIIITTRYKHQLNVLEADEVYNVEGLNTNEALQLFSWHAFRTKSPLEDYVKISFEVVDYVGGIPLALKVMGSFLLGRSKKEWRTAIEKLKGVQHNEIQEKLRISFDALDDTEKDIFLDVACFFVEMNKDDVIRILEGCGFFAEIGINDLIHRSLIEITENNMLWMHSVLREMGRQIVREESIEIPGKRSRLWVRQETFDVLTKCMGTKAVEGIALDLSKLEIVKFNTEAFAEMPKLRLLQVNYVHLLGDYKHLSKELRWLCWHGFPLNSIPNNFNMGNLVFLDMQHSNIREFSEESKQLKKLEVLNLSHSTFLKRTPNFVRFPNIVKLILADCNSLAEVHQSIGNSHKLVFLNLQDCRSLKNLPVTICNLTSLENLTLSGCSKLDKLPEELGNMGSLKELLADGTAIKQLPFSIGHFKDLKSLSIGGFKGSPPKSWHSFFSSWGSKSKVPNSISILPASFSLLRSLKSLILKGCNLSEGAIPCDLGTLSSLEELDLGYNNFCSLPANISSLSHLRKLLLRECRMLQSLPELPSNLEGLCTNGCTSLQSLPELGNLSSLFELDLSYNNFLTLPSSISGLSQLVYLKLDHCTRLQSIPELPSSVWNLNLEGCTSMDRLSNLSNLKELPALMLRNCDEIVEIQDLEKLEMVDCIHLEGCNNLSNAFKQNVLQKSFTQRTRSLRILLSLMSITKPRVLSGDTVQQLLES
ncbi:disease resistance protein RPV1-like isoform X2 [Macadamia integrifolia]|uniref:disease resistance protein RPV1-like isoform X2 n=1 Tax=Macadamia integrifolia TaxID=60698 RepID=UPI001C4F3EBE|nr:disease resistance protein RPV1-like isoform X2 [Macadamia integrifolia]